MTHAVNAAYAHRHNRDGSIDSICKTCFATVAQVRDEFTLTQHERAHSCPAWILAGRGNLISMAPSTGMNLIPRPMNMKPAIWV
jgi:hypothetical protein